MGLSSCIPRFWTALCKSATCRDRSRGTSFTVVVVRAHSPADKQDAYFVGEMYPRLAAKLVDPTGDAVLTQSRCNAFESIESRLFYTSNTRKVHLVPETRASCGSGRL